MHNPRVNFTNTIHGYNSNNFYPPHIPYKKSPQQSAQLIWHASHQAQQRTRQFWHTTTPSHWIHGSSGRSQNSIQQDSHEKQPFTLVAQKMAGQIVMEHARRKARENDSI